MNLKTENMNKAGFLRLILICMLLNFQALGQGDEKHDDAKTTKSTGVSSQQTSMVRSKGVKDFEITLKHPILEPFKVAIGNLFVTRYESNEPVSINIAADLVSSSGKTINISVEKSNSTGIYKLDFPGLEKGSYNLLIKLDGANLKETVTFSDLKVSSAKTQNLESNNSYGWIAFAGFALLTFGLTVYFSKYFSKQNPAESHAGEDDIDE